MTCFPFISPSLEHNKSKWQFKFFASPIICHWLMICQYTLTHDIDCNLYVKHKAAGLKLAKFEKFTNFYAYWHRQHIENIANSSSLLRLAIWLYALTFLCFFQFQSRFGSSLASQHTPNCHCQHFFLLHRQKYIFCLALKKIQDTEWMLMMSVKSMENM